MPAVTVHYDGWVQLPAGSVQSLGLRSSDRLEVTQADGGILLRVAVGRGPTTEPATEPLPPSPIIEEHTGEDAGVVADTPQQEEIVKRKNAESHSQESSKQNGSDNS